MRYRAGVSDDRRYGPFSLRQSGDEHFLLMLWKSTSLDQEGDRILDDLLHVFGIQV